MFPSRFGALFVPEQLDTIPGTLPLLHELAQRGKPWDVPQGADAPGVLVPLPPECLVPILGRNSRLIDLLVLGQRLSEEPYSREDKQLLDSVASQAGITLEKSGGLLPQWLLGYNFSVAVWVGYIALFWNCRRFTSLNLIPESKPFSYQLHEFALCFALFGAAIEVCKRRSGLSSTSAPLACLIHQS